MDRSSNQAGRSNEDQNDDAESLDETINHGAFAKRPRVAKDADRHTSCLLDLGLQRTSKNVSAAAKNQVPDQDFKGTLVVETS